MVQITLLVSLAAFASALNTLQTRSFSQVYNDLLRADNDTVALTSAVRSFVPGSQAVGPGPSISQRIQSLEYDYDNCTLDARKNTPPPLSGSQVGTICSYIKGKLFDDTKTMLDAFVAKKTALTSAGLKTTIVQDLQTLEDDTRGCVVQIEGGITSESDGKAENGKKEGTKISPGPVSACRSALASYSSVYSSAIAAYS